MRTKQRHHPVSNDDITHAAKLYYSRPPRALTNGVQHEVKNTHCTARYVIEGNRVRCTVVASGQTNMSKWFWLPLRASELEQELRLMEAIE